MFRDKQLGTEMLSYEYIRGLVEGEGCFTFCSSSWKNQPKRKLPTFMIGMSAKDKDLLNKVRDSLCLRNKVYEYAPRLRKDGYRRDGMAMLMVRDVGQLKNIIIPLFYKKLNGNKRKQFEAWVESIGTDPMVPSSYKFIHKIYNAGFYDKNPDPIVSSQSKSFATNNLK